MWLYRDTVAILPGSEANSNDSGVLSGSGGAGDGGLPKNLERGS